MVKRLLIPLFFFCYFCSTAQQVTRGEYFFNTDPGIGNATAITFTAADSINITTGIPLPASLPMGINRLYVRVVNNNGVWSQPEVFMVVVSSFSTQINKAEYFFNSDPGTGNGTPIVFTPADSVNLGTMIIIPASLPSGINSLYVRTQNTGMTWSMPELFMITVNTAVSLINSGEYFWDTDPGLGNGTAFSFSPADSVILLQNITIPALSSGIHKLYVRIRNTEGTWSMPEFFDISICTESITSQPANQTVCAGSNATFNVTATGTGLTYQWRKNGTNINGATGASYTINGVVAGDAGNYDVVIAGSCGSLTSVPATLVVNAAMVITTQPSGQSVCPGSNVSFSVAGTGSGTLTYQWRKDGVNISGANSSSYAINGVVTTDAANYDVIVTGACGSVTSSPAALTIIPATSITTQPANQSSCTGGSVTFSVIAVGNNLTYQWQKNGVNISGATSSSYTINIIIAGDAGVYSAVVTGTCGIVTSSGATLTISENTVINTPPASQSVCPGSNVTFSVSASGGGTLTYQWKKNGVNIPGATSSSFTINGVVSGDAANYTVDVTSSCGVVTSNTATLSLLQSTSISTQPSNQTVCPGSNATFSVVGNGINLTYQWRKNSTDITGATGSSYSINGVVAGDAATYDVIVTGSCGTLTSSSAILSLNSATAITTQPVSQTVCPSTNVTFNTTATGTALTYQWRKNTVNIPGATSSSYSIPVVVAGDAGTYDVIINGTCGSVTSSSATLSVNAATTITTQPVSQIVCPGSNVTFNTTASGTALNYQWRKGGVNISGANSSSYTVNNVSTADVGNYDVIVSGSCGTLTSGSAALTINQAPSISTQPANQTAFVGTNVIFTVAATGSGLTYQWRKAGVNISGANSSSYTINNVAAADAGNYDVVISGTCPPPVTSNIATLTVNAVSISMQPLNQAACVGNNATFTIVANGVNLTYQWQISTGGGSFANIPGATSASLTLTSITPSQNGNQYRCVVSGSLNSNAAILTVNPLPTVTLNLPFDTLTLNSPMQVLSGGTPAGGVYSGTGISAGSFLPAAYNIGNYTVNYRYTDANGCSSSASDVFTIIPKADKVNIFPNPAESGNINIAVSSDLIGGRAIFYNSKGQKMSEWQIRNRLTSFRLKWNAGHYTAVFIFGNTEIKKQFIIIR